MKQIFCISVLLAALFCQCKMNDETPSSTSPNRKNTGTQEAPSTAGKQQLPNGTIVESAHSLAANTTIRENDEPGLVGVRFLVNVETMTATSLRLAGYPGDQVTFELTFNSFRQAGSVPVVNGSASIAVQKIPSGKGTLLLTVVLPGLGRYEGKQADLELRPGPQTVNLTLQKISDMTDLIIPLPTFTPSGSIIPVPPLGSPSASSSAAPLPSGEAFPNTAWYGVSYEGAGNWVIEPAL